MPPQYSSTRHRAFSLLITLYSLVLFAILLSPSIPHAAFNFQFDQDWNEGFRHPLTGWDHVLVMVAVGVWAAQIRGQALWVLPVVFVSVMSLGGLIGAASLIIPGAEAVILLSCLSISALIARGIRFSTPVNIIIISLFAFFHGYVHGQEISASASLASYTTGFMLATLFLHGAGILIFKLAVLAITCFVSSSLHAQNTAAHADANAVKSGSRSDRLAHVVLDEVIVERSRYRGETPLSNRF